MLDIPWLVLVKSSNLSYTLGKILARSEVAYFTHIIYIRASPPGIIHGRGWVLIIKSLDELKGIYPDVLDATEDGGQPCCYTRMLYSIVINYLFVVVSNAVDQ